ncbi:MAG: NUDIX domain-containing protein [bacterium]|nr:NUDIX domain-containing protein [bacterium]
MDDLNKKPGIGVGVMILRDDKVLLGKRHSDPQKADSELHGEGRWTMPGGKLHFGEKLKEAAFRETFEETGIRINQEKLEIISVADDMVEDAHFVTIGFLCKDFEGEAKVMEPDEITEWQWFSLNNLPEPIYFPSKGIIEHYLEKSLI